MKRDTGELICAFRRAPERKMFGENGSNHTDANSYLVLVRSQDNGETWTTNPELILAHPYGGSQDPCMTQLRDGAIICSSYGWSAIRGEAIGKIEDTYWHSEFGFMGGYLMRSEDGGHSWQGPMQPPVVPGNKTKTVFGEPSPAYNRGAMCESKDGTLYWAVTSQPRVNPRLTELHLMASRDGGLTWEYRCPIAQDETIHFNEASLYETPTGTLVAFIRTANFDDHTVVVRSTDAGKSFQPWEDSGFQGHPHYALRLPDDDVLLVYGYRHKPFGIRARILNPECTNYAEVEEIVLRDDGGSTDLGYPWATMTEDGRVLAVYYFNQADGTRHIAGTWLKVIPD